ncbi:MAG: hypothetical protein OXR66_08100 [Candidatus Woesearchaeota archaeon]|nr:hypothetical protein [Candidatus Woesearchaeota archaeon]
MAETRVHQLRAALTSDSSFDLEIADLVMMQMAGDFNAFTKALQGKQLSTARELIQTTRAQVTSFSLFERIVDKTIRAQFGEKEAAIRELGQNGLDAYDPSAYRRIVQFDIHEEADHTVLSARDYGVGMSFVGLVRDLLVPFNSKKEFNPNLIGEHGIGWYSNADLGEVVRVTTRQHADTTSSIVYNEDGKWRALLAPDVENGFAPSTDRRKSGTQVDIFIPNGDTSPAAIRDAMYKYLGMVPASRGMVLLGKEKINAVRKSYRTTSPIRVSLENKSGYLSMGVSKRHFGKNGQDSRFRIRDNNSSKLLVTQNGLFVRYGEPSFNGSTLHESLLEDAVSAGLDFWVDLPPEVTLTKGRNNIVGHDRPYLNDPLREAFEEMYLDAVLGDQELLNNAGSAFLESVAGMFDREYSRIISSFATSEFSFRRRVLARGAAVGNFFVDSMYGLKANLGNLASDTRDELTIWTTQKYPQLSTYFKNDLPTNVRTLAKHTPQVVGGATAIAGVGVGVYHGVTMFRRGLEGLLGKDYPLLPTLGAWASGVLLYAVGRTLGPTVLKASRKLSSDFAALGWDITKRMCVSGVAMYRDIRADIRENGNPFPRIASNIRSFIQDKTGLYKNVNQKRERKLRRINERVARGYIKKFRKDPFLQKIMGKKIVEATRYYEKEPRPHRTRRIRRLVDSFSDATSFVFYPLMETDPYANMQPPRQHKSDVLWHKVKLSIDDLLKLHTTRQLQLMNPNTGTKPIRIPGMYVVDETNPLVGTITQRIEDINADAQRIYDVKVLEDRIDNIVEFANAALATAYILSPIGFGHAVYSTIKNRESRFSDRLAFKGIEKLTKFSGRALDGARKKLATAKLSDVLASVAATHNTRDAGTAEEETLLERAYNRCADLLYDAKHVAARTVRYALSDFTRSMIRGGKNGLLFIPKFARDQAINLWNGKSAIQKNILESKTGLLVGYGLLYGRKINSVSPERLRECTTEIGAGGVYANVLDFVKEMDQFTSAILDREPHPEVYGAYKSGKTKKFADNHEGLFIDLSGRLYFDFRDGMHLVRCASNRGYTDTIEYEILDTLLHHYAHEDTNTQHPRTEAYKHRKNMFERKEELRNRVVEHMVEHNLDLRDIADRHLPMLPEKAVLVERVRDFLGIESPINVTYNAHSLLSFSDPNYYVSGSDLCRIVHAPSFSRQKLRRAFEIAAESKRQDMRHSITIVNG